MEESPAADGQQRTTILPEIWGREGRCWQTLVVIAQGRGREAVASNAFRQLALQAASGQRVNVSVAARPRWMRRESPTMVWSHRLAIRALELNVTGMA